MKHKSSLFGEFFKTKRIEKGLTLREFCRKYGYNPGNMSKIERGILNPPSSQEKLEKYASYLGIKKGTDDYLEFFDRAAACKGELPKEIMEDSEVVKKLPIIFRTMRGKKVTSELLDDLVNKIKRA